jgi:hypothetical protein
MFCATVVGALVSACSAGTKGGPGNLNGDGGSPGNETGTIGFDAGGEVPTIGGFETGAIEGGGGTGEGGACHSATDCDGDGFTAAQGDCDDSDATINPHAYDFPGDGVDNDCDGTKDNPVDSCAPSTSSKAAVDFARAADLCPQRSTDSTTGKPYDFLVSATWEGVSGLGPFQTQAASISGDLGDMKTRLGGSMIGMSNGKWGFNDPEADDPLEGMSGSGVDGCAKIPLKGADCTALTNGTSSGGAVTVHDYTELKVVVNAPSNANAMQFDFAFMSSEFDQYYNSNFNDAFFAIVTTSAIAGQNVSKDSKGNAITINSGFFALCPTTSQASGDTSGGLGNCVGITGAPSASPPVLGGLPGTNYDGASATTTTGLGTTITGDVMSSGGEFGLPATINVYGGGTGWLTTQFQVKPGEQVTIRFMVMDASDGVLDSAVLIDHITWQKAPPEISTGGVDRPPS